jgi:ribosome-associated heat shock protein Hsp15
MHGLRLDKWLWAARFFKTRTLATEAVENGRVRVNQARAKPAKEIRAGDMLQIQIGTLHWEVQVIALSDKRGSASIARLLYQETIASIAQRAATIEQQKLQKEPALERKGRPTKRERRDLEQLSGKSRGDW